MTNPDASTRPNRRVTARLACQLSVRYRVATSWHPASAMDLSAHGCRLRLGEDLPRGSAVKVLFETPLKDGSRTHSAEVSGLVTWSRVEGLSHQVGVHFDSAPPELDDLIQALS